MRKSAFDLFLEWPRIPIPTVVDVLRSVHERASDAASAPIPRADDAAQSSMRAASDETRSSPGLAEADPEAPLPPASDDAGASRYAALPDLSPLLGALATLQRAARGEAAEPATYDQMRRQFFEFQSQLRRQKLAIERLLGRTFDPNDASPAPPPVFQQSLQIQCARSGQSSARFRCVNRTDRTTAVTVSAGPLLGDASGRLEHAVLTASPDTCTLAPGGERTVLVTVDLSQCNAPDSHAGAALDVAMDGELALKVWVAVELHD